MDETSLPARVLLMARLLAVVALVRRYGFIPEPYGAFLPFIDDLPGEAWSKGLTLCFHAGAVLLLFTRRARLGCLMCGLPLLLTVLASHARYTNHTLFAAMLFVLAALTDRDGPPRLLQLQIILVYIGAGIDKAADPDWWSGQFFEHWMIGIEQSPFYTQLSSLLPAMVFSKAMSWSTIAIELTLPLLFLFMRTQMAGVWLAIGFHLGSAIFAQSDFGIFVQCTAISMLAFVPPPEAHATALERRSSVWGAAGWYLLAIVLSTQAIAISARMAVGCLLFACTFTQFAMGVRITGKSRCPSSARPEFPEG